MVITDPRTNDGRKAKEATIRVIDLVIYAGVLACGVFALIATPTTVLQVLNGFEWLVVLWASLLTVGGLLGFVGRLTRLWALELPGTSAGITGCIIYAIVLAKTSFTNPLVLVAVILVIIATLTLVRRYIEMQIFTSEPGTGTFLTRLRVAPRRRTTDAVRRQD
jgi:hypothetical protein